MKSMPKIEEYMTKNPITIEPDETVKAALKIMRERKVRHLPVCEGKQVLGIVSEANAHLGNILPGGETFKVRDVMVPNLKTFTPGTPLDEVVVSMAENKHDYVIVQKTSGEVLGIFTAVDALDVLILQLRGQHWPALQS